MAEGVAEAIATEQHEVVRLLGSLPRTQLPADVQLQLQELGVHYDATGAAAAEDFDIPDFSAEELLQLGGNSSSSSDNSRDLLWLATYLANTADLSCVLEHRDELAAASMAGAGLEQGGSRLLSRSQSALDNFGDNSDAVAHASRLLLDQEIEVSAADLEDGDSAEGAAGDKSNRGDGTAESWGGGMGGGFSRQKGALQLPAGSLKIGKLSVLGQLKAQRKKQMLPPSNKPLSQNAQVKPSLEVRRHLCNSLGCLIGLPPMAQSEQPAVFEII